MNLSDPSIPLQQRVQFLLIHGTVYEVASLLRATTEEGEERNNLLSWIEKSSGWHKRVRIEELL